METNGEAATSEATTEEQDAERARLVRKFIALALALLLVVVGAIVIVKILTDSDSEDPLPVPDSNAPLDDSVFLDDRYAAGARPVELETDTAQVSGFTSDREHLVVWTAPKGSYPWSSASPNKVQVYNVESGEVVAEFDLEDSLPTNAYTEFGAIVYEDAGELVLLLPGA